MSLKRVDKVATCGIPEFAGSIIAASDKLIPIFVEAAVGEGQHMPLKFLHQLKLLLSFFFDLLHQF